MYKKVFSLKYIHISTPAGMFDSIISLGEINQGHCAAWRKIFELSPTATLRGFAAPQKRTICDSVFYNFSTTPMQWRCHLISINNTVLCPTNILPFISSLN